MVGKCTVISTHSNDVLRLIYRLWEAASVLEEFNSMVTH